MNSQEIKQAVRAAGFDLVGIAPAVSPAGFGPLQTWLEQGYAGQMLYIERRKEAYAHPAAVLDGVRSIVMLGANYRTAEPAAAGPLDGRVSRYAWGRRDYHDVLRERLKTLAGQIETARPGAVTRGVVDTAPLLERDFARLAGLGWFGKNTLLINKQAGSWLFLSALLVDFELEYDAPHATSHCGTCTRCLDACPTDAFVAPYVLDARKCISYLTIELREPIPLELRSGMGDWVLGCDICQDVCPWNRKAPVKADPDFEPRADLSPVAAAELLGLEETEFRQRFRGTPLSRPKRAGLLRNAAIVLGNSGDDRALPALAQALNDTEPMVRGACAWALGQLGGDAVVTVLSQRQTIETDPRVSEELAAALETRGEGREGDR